MAQNDQPAPRRTRPFADFLADHNRGAGHTKASESLQELVNAVIDTGKKGTVTLTVSVEPMKNSPETLMTTVNVVSKLPQPTLKGAVFYADDEGNLQREDPRQEAFEGLKEADGPALKDSPVAAPALRDAAGGAR